MDWLSLGIILVAIAALVVVNIFTDAGSFFNCQMTWRNALKSMKLKNERSLKEDASKPTAPENKA